MGFGRQDGSGDHHSALAMPSGTVGQPAEQLQRCRMVATLQGDGRQRMAQESHRLA